MPTVHRRTFLAALAVTGGAAACTSAVDTSTRGTADSQPDPQLADLTAERQLLATYDATVKTHAALASRLTPLREHHAAHATALEQAIADPPTASTVAATVPGTPAEALAALRTAEREAAVARTRSCVSARPDRAPLLGSIAACEASHEVLLT